MANSPEMMVNQAQLPGIDTPMTPSAIPGMPSLIIPVPFSIADPKLKSSFDKIKTEIVDKSVQWENRMTPMFGEYEEYTDSWRVQGRRPKGMPNSLFNSVSGETH